MGHMAGQVANTGLTSGKTSVIKFINCSFKEDALIKGYSKTSGASAEFEAYDLREGKNTYTSSANTNKQLMGGTLSHIVYVGLTEDTTTAYVVKPEGARSNLKFFAHGGTEAAPGRASSTVVNYPAE